jgi:predicted transcriptional regulator
MLHGKTLHVDANASDELVVSTLKALASLPRWRILEFLSGGGHSVSEVAEALELPISTAAAQIKILEDAKFLHTELQAANHGLQKFCTRTYDNIVIDLPTVPEFSSSSVELSMPVGAYTRFEVASTCGLASESSLIGYLDDPLSFYEPDRIKAGLIWFRAGYVEYSFPNRLPGTATPRSVLVSAEVCSEAPLHNNDWPSDITLWVNDLEVGTWTCPGDFGGQRGRLTPQWWDSKDSQYGVLKRWLINEAGAFVDGYPLSNLTIRDLGLEKRGVVTVRLGVKHDAMHVGGMNLFGRSFGNYPQDLTLRTEYTPGRRSDGKEITVAYPTSPDHEEVMRATEESTHTNPGYLSTNSQRRKQVNVDQV